MRFSASVVVLLFGLLSFAASGSAEEIDAVRSWRQANAREILDELIQFVQIPNESRDRANIVRNARHLVGMMEKRGLSPRLLEVPEAAPVVYGELRVPNALRTYVFYAHYDGQPIGDPKEWATPPYEVTLRDGKLDAGGQVVPLMPTELRADRDWRLYARSVADDKAGVMTILSAVNALQATGQAPRANLKFVFEGEEETGSDHFEAILASNRELLRSDGWIICDGPIHASGRQSVAFGVRGVVSFEVTVYGANRSLHSGHFGNWAPNPAMMLSQLLASMKDEEGHVLIAGFYDSVAPLGPTERTAISEISDNDETQMRSLGLIRADGRGARLAELINEPSLNIGGLSSGRVGGQVALAIPATATAAIDVRLVKGVTRAQVTHQLTEHIRAHGYHVTSQPPTDQERLAHARIAQVTVTAQGYEALRTPMDSDFARTVRTAVTHTKRDAVMIPSMGGSLPLAMIEQALGAPVIIVPMSNPDSNQHAKNENLRVQNLWDGIDTYSALLLME